MVFAYTDIQNFNISEVGHKAGLWSDSVAMTQDATFSSQYGLKLFESDHKSKDYNELWCFYESLLN